MKFNAYDTMSGELLFGGDTFNRSGLTYCSAMSDTEDMIAYGSNNVQVLPQIATDVDEMREAIAALQDELGALKELFEVKIRLRKSEPFYSSWHYRRSDYATLK